MRRLGVFNAWSESEPAVQAFVTAVRRLWSVSAGSTVRISRSTIALPRAIRLSSRPMRRNWSRCRRTQFSLAPFRQSERLQDQTRTIPIIFTHLPDPVGLGIVQSIARPGGNITGFADFDAPLMGKWLQLLKEIAPGPHTSCGHLQPGYRALRPPFLNRAIEAAAPAQYRRASRSAMTVRPHSSGRTRSRRADIRPRD